MLPFVMASQRPKEGYSRSDSRLDRLALLHINAIKTGTHLALQDGCLACRYAGAGLLIPPDTGCELIRTLATDGRAVVLRIGYLLGRPIA